MNGPPGEGGSLSRRWSTSRVVGIVAILCLVGAAWASFTTTSVDGRSCGTWVSSQTAEVTYDGSYVPLRDLDTSEAYADVTDLDGCADALILRRTLALSLLTGAVVLGVSAVVLRRRGRSAGATDSSTPPRH